MMPTGMPTGWNWGSAEFTIVIPSIAVGALIIAIMFILFRRDGNGPSNSTNDHTLDSRSTPIEATANMNSQPRSFVLGEVVRTLSPTLMDDEKRLMDNLARAGGEVLQSDLPRMTDFSKATVSKAIHSLEVRGIVVREKHKWTYWCKINPRLIERVQSGEIVLPPNPGSRSSPV